MKVKELKTFLETIEGDIEVNVDFFHYENGSLSLGHSEAKPKYDSLEDINEGDIVEAFDGFGVYRGKYLCVSDDDGLLFFRRNAPGKFKGIASRWHADDFLNYKKQNK